MGLVMQGSDYEGCPPPNAVAERKPRLVKPEDVSVYPATDGALYECERVDGVLRVVTVRANSKADAIKRARFREGGSRGAWKAERR